MNSSRALLLAEFVLVSAITVAQDKLSRAKSETIGGFIDERLSNSYKNRVLLQDADALIEPFKHRNETSFWQRSNLF